MKQVCDGVMTLDSGAARCVDVEFDITADRGSVVAFKHVEPHVTGFLRVGDAPEIRTGAKFARVTDLAAHFGVARARIEDDSQLALEVDNFEDLGSNR
jgi:hypothetical protein